MNNVNMTIINIADTLRQAIDPCTALLKKSMLLLHSALLLKTSSQYAWQDLLNE